MKRIMLIVLVLVMIVSLAACGEEPSGTKTANHNMLRKIDQEAQVVCYYQPTTIGGISCLPCKDTELDCED